jgi:hypothetical protein
MSRKSITQDKENIIVYLKEDRIKPSQYSRNSFISTAQSDMSNSLDSSGISCDSLIDHQSFSDLRNRKPTSRIGEVKEGFWILSHINPISRYNFMIERYNEEMNKFNDITLRRIPFSHYLRLLYDFMIIIWRITFALPLILISIIMAKRGWLTSYNELFIFYSLSGNPTLPYRENNLLLFFISIPFLGLLYILLVSYPLPVFLFVTLSLAFDLYGFIYYRYNRDSIGKHMYRNMVYDEGMAYERLNDYITVVPHTIESFANYSYYTFLQYLYKKKDMTIPQYFMTYGRQFVRENTVIVRALYVDAVAFLISGMMCLSYYVYNN